MAAMTRERFQALAEAFGGDVSRWPAAARESAALLMAAEPDVTGAVLARARALDEALDGWRAAPARAELAEQILAAAPRPRRRWAPWLSPAALGAGLAAACAAGVVVGVQVSLRSGETSEVATINALSVEPAYDILEGA